MAAKKKKVGRPSKLTAAVRRRIRRLAPLGLTDKQFAAVLGISVVTWDNWKNDPEFLGELLEDKEFADQMVQTSFYSQALSGDPKACFLWLKNRQPKKWKDRHEITGADGRSIEINMNFKAQPQEEKE